MVSSTKETLSKPGQTQRQPKAKTLLTQILEEQRKTNQLLLMLIEALGQEEAEMCAEPATYIDGTPVDLRHG